MGLQAGNWEWYYPDGGKKRVSIHSLVGYSQPAVSSIKRHAMVMAAEARAELSLHRDTGDAHIGAVHMGEDAEGHRPDLDSVVYLAASDEGERDPDEGKEVPGTDDGSIYTNAHRAVMSIEFGHYTGGRAMGPRTRKQHRRTRVKGLGVLQKASKKMVAKRRMSIK
jgi:hypothetical protein